MSSEWEDLANDPVFSPNRKKGCRVCDLLAELTAEQAAVVTSVVCDPTRSVTAIQKALKRRGVNTGKDKLVQHRNGECSG